MFHDVLGVEFPKDMGELFKSILIRHDIVHRNGKTKDGTAHALTDADIRKLIGTVGSFVSGIEGRWNQVKTGLPPIPGLPTDL